MAAAVAAAAPEPQRLSFQERRAIRNSQIINEVQQLIQTIKQHSRSLRMLDWYNLRYKNEKWFNYDIDKIMAKNFETLPVTITSQAKSTIILKKAIERIDKIEVTGTITATTANTMGITQALFMLLRMSSFNDQFKTMHAVYTLAILNKLTDDEKMEFLDVCSIPHIKRCSKCIGQYLLILTVIYRRIGHASSLALRELILQRLFQVLREQIDKKIASIFTPLLYGLARGSLETCYRLIDSGIFEMVVIHDIKAIKHMRQLINKMSESERFAEKFISLFDEMVTSKTDKEQIAKLQKIMYRLAAPLKYFSTKILADPKLSYRFAMIDLKITKFEDSDEDPYEWMLQ